jgi:autotransporter-associated beta strand protein
MLAGDLEAFVGPLPADPAPAEPAAVVATASLVTAFSLPAGGLELPDLTAHAVLALHDQVESFATLTATAVTMTGRSELWITGSTSPITGSTFQLNSEDAWLFFPAIKPSVVNASYLGQIRVSGRLAVNGSTVRVVQYGTGTVVIPHAPSFAPLEVFTGPNFTGETASFGQYTYFNSAATLGGMQGAISSFRLARGYMATFATAANGSGVSKVYVAQDHDLDISYLPAELDNAVQFVRVIPWRWVAKKGASDLSADVLDAAWKYNWNNNLESTLDWEYVPIRQQRYWPGLPTTKQNVTSLLGFNEPNNPVEDAYQTLGNGSIDAAIAFWPQMLSSGLRVGSPAVTDGGKAWLYEFMDKAIAANLRVDYIAIHNYQANHSASSLFNWLKDIYDRYQLPIWVTEFNNGANWTSAPDPTLQQNAAWVASITEMFDTTPWIERYSIYSNVEAVRKMVDGSGNLTPAGVVYTNNDSPIGYVQDLPAAAAAAGRGVARFGFEGDSLDGSGFGNNGQIVGAPGFVTGRQGQALRFDGTSTAVRLPADVARGSAFSFAAWVNWEGGGNWQRIFDFGNGTNSYMFLTPSNGSSLRFGIKHGGSEQRVQTGRLTVGQWTHVAVTLGGGTARLYVNGSLAAINTAVSLTPASLDLVRNSLGDSQFAADPLFKGTLDEVLISDVPLSPSQIAGLAANRPPAFPADRIAIDPISRGTLTTGSLAGRATDPDGDPLTYAKIYGPAWLHVAANGNYAGTLPADAQGQQEFLITATDSRGATSFVTMVAPVGEVYWQGDLSGVWTATSNGDTNWALGPDDPADPGVLPDESTLAVFAASTARNLPVITFGEDVSVRGIRVTAPSGLSLRGTNSVTLGRSGLELAPGVNASAILTTGPVVLGADQTWSLASDLTVMADVTGGASLTKTGTGTLRILGSGSYTGGTTIEAGTLQLGVGGVSGSISGDVVNNGSLVVNRSDEVILSGRISGSGSLIKRAPGRLVLAAANSLTGPTIVEAGTVAVRDPAALGSGSLRVGAAGTVQLDVGLASVSAAGLELAEGARVELGTGGLAIAAGGADEATLRGWLLAGRNNGAWDGPTGIRSAAASGSRTIGYQVDSDGSATVFWTAVGDLDGNRVVDVFDLISMDSAARYGSGQPATWAEGDVNYDGRADVFDLIGVDSAGSYGAGPVAAAEDA